MNCKLANYGNIYDCSQNPDYRIIYFNNEKCLYIFIGDKPVHISSQIINTHNYCDNFLAITTDGSIYIIKVPEIFDSMLEYKSINYLKQDGSLIKTGNSIIFELFKYKDSNPNNYFIAVHIDMEGRNYPKQYGLVMSAGGIIDPGSNALDTAIKESNEEHGLNKGNPDQYILLGSDKNQRYNYFLRNVTPFDYNWSDIINGLTPFEIGSDPNTIPYIYGKKNCIQVGGIDSAVYLVRLCSLLDITKKNYAFGPFIDNLKKYIDKF